MATNSTVPNTDTFTQGSTQSDKPAFRGQAEEAADRAILAGAPVDHTLGDRNAALTETPVEKEIDAANGLRGAKGPHAHGGGLRRFAHPRRRSAAELSVPMSPTAFWCSATMAACESRLAEWELCPRKALFFI